MGSVGLGFVKILSALVVEGEDESWILPPSFRACYLGDIVVMPKSV
jgi:hypothetical protein